MGGPVYNFSAGPAGLPGPVLARVRDELPSLNGSGQSILEVPFSSSLFREVLAKAEADLRELMAIPDDYAVLFLQGGASAQFSLVPLNLLAGKTRVDYVETGYWSHKAIVEAARYCEVNVSASSADSGFDRVPDPGKWAMTSGAAYCHITSNETADGVEYPWTPMLRRTPLVADMSSNFLTRPVDVTCYGLIYASAQKNVGPSGLAVVIVRRDLLGRALPATPAVFNYTLQVQAGSLLNTPPTFAIYLAGLVFRWIADNGGLDEMERRAVRRSALMYAAIDDSGGFYHCPALPAYRSRLNICFRLRREELTEAFVSEAQAEGLLNLKGHSRIGGLRASLYNAMPVVGVEALVGFLADFARRHG